MMRIESDLDSYAKNDIGRKWIRVFPDFTDLGMN